MSPSSEPDVIVVGGGPAGSTCASMLAMRGRRVVLYERQRHPRYHIGESLIPFCYYTLARLGLAERMRRSPCIKKFSVQFVGISGAETRPFYFFEHLYHPSAVAWQVLRSDFDRMLLDNAVSKGVEVIEDCAVDSFALDGSQAVTGVRVRGPDGSLRTISARMTIDASGRDALAPKQFGWRTLDTELNRFALWTYFTGAVRDPGIDAGATTVAAVPGGGWFWYIPLHNDTISVGVVHRREWLFKPNDGSGQPDLDQIYQRAVAQNPWVARHLHGGTRCDQYRVTNEYSYRSSHCARDGLVLAGDALSFLDPIFSSGVYLALRMGELAAEAVDEALHANDVSAPRFATYGATVAAGVQAIRSLVYSYYAPDFSFSQLIKRDPASRVDISDLLIGNFFRDYGPFYELVKDVTKGLPTSTVAMPPWSPRQELGA
jgi:flavin-dependent dehydrogenase